MCNSNECNGRVFDESKVLKDNAMLKVRPELFLEWDFDKNDALGLDVYKVTKGMHKIVWWKCSKCKSSYDLSPYRNTRNKSCPYCAGSRVNHSNSLYIKCPDLASEWHPTKNGELTPHKVTENSQSRVWWLGKCGHEWDAEVRNRNGKNTKCPYCTSNPQVLKGFNDMWTTNPELASLLSNSEDGYKYTKNSNHKLNWRCPHCKREVGNKKISKVSIYGVSCVNCSDGFSFPEKMMYHLLLQLNVKFETQCTFNWSDNKRYDFHIPSLNMIIETHGAQHTKVSGFSYLGGKTLEEEQMNDAYKKNLAVINGIEHYIEVDCSYSIFDYIKNNILNSNLLTFIDFTNVDWKAINLNTQKSINFEILKLWNEGLSAKEISNIYKLIPATIIKVLKNYDSIGMCKYYPKRGIERYHQQFSERKIYQLDKELNLVKVWLGLESIENELGIDRNLIVRCRSGRNKTSHGYIWKYEEDLVGLSVPINK